MTVVTMGVGYSKISKRGMEEASREIGRALDCTCETCITGTSRRPAFNATSLKGRQTEPKEGRLVSMLIGPCKIHGESGESSSARLRCVGDGWRLVRVYSREMHWPIRALLLEQAALSLKVWFETRRIT